MTFRSTARVLAAAGALAVFSWPAGAAPQVQPVNIQFQDFGPDKLDALPGDTVQWQNVSERTHTVTADDASFDSGDLGPGDGFTREFDTTGVFAYHCTKHAGMVGEVDVRPLTLGPLPTAPIPSGNRVEFGGRSVNAGQPVRVETSADGSSFHTIATATPAANGSWSVTAAAQATGDYRASNDAGTSETRHMLVSDRKVLVRAARRGVTVTVVPSLPYGHVVLQELLRVRFGWWPVTNARLDYVSAASFKVKRPARVRVVLVDKDGWTPLATSAVLTLGHVHR